MQKLSVALLFLGLASSATLTASPVRAWESDQLPRNYALKMRPGTAHSGFLEGAGGVLGHRAAGALLGVDSIPTFSSYFYDPGVDSTGNTQFTWQFTMVGNSPFKGDADDAARATGTTHINAPIVPVTLDLRDANGAPRSVKGRRLISSPEAYVASILASPIFQPTTFTSSAIPTQFTDALLRAEFYRVADRDWHTLLRSSVKPGRTMILKQGTYRFALNSDGGCCEFVLVDPDVFTNALFPATPGDAGSVVGQAELAGDITTKDISTFLFPNTFLWMNHDPKQCCIVGFHAYDVEPGDKSNGFRERRYVLNYSSWVTPGVFSDATFADVAALSHELAETFNDPFVTNATPWWLSPNGLCQNNLETGDVIEGLASAGKTIFLGGWSYHVQNEALLQWFAGQTPSTAIHGAYSYPDPILTSAASSEAVNCTGPSPNVATETGIAASIAVR